MMIACLHGFWQTGDVWDKVLAHLGADTEIPFKAWAPDLFSEGSLSPRYSFSEWCENFHKLIENRDPSEGPRWLVGYSMGGRLALHALQSRPDLWSGAVILSAHPGFFLETEDHKVVRQRWEQMWAQRFLEEPWPQLFEDWENLGVFSGGRKAGDMPESKTQFSRELLAESLVSWSPTQHTVSEQWLRSPGRPILWVCGEHDIKYTELYDRCRQRGFSGQWQTLLGAGHRVITDRPRLVAQSMASFIQERRPHG